MKLGILTFHRTVNDGSVLQNWCLQRVLRRLSPGARVETVDLRITSREKQEYRRLLSRRPPFIQLATVSKMLRLRDFIRQEIALSAGSRTTDSLEAARDFLADQRYDAVVSGSDTVWQMARVGTVPPPHLYFMPGFSGFRKVAFAVSADPVADQAVLRDPQRREAVLAAASDFDFIGVRDQTTRSVLEQLGIPANRIEFVPDPTVLEDFSSLVRLPAKPLVGKVAGIALQSPALAAEISDLLQLQGWTVVNHLGPTPPGARALPGSESLGDRLGRFATQDLLISDRFHSSIFTLKLGRAPAIFVESPQKWPEPTSKGRDLLNRLGCGDFVWRSGDNTKRGLSPLLEAVEAWRFNPPDLKARFQALADSSRPALDKLATVLSQPG